MRHYVLYGMKGVESEHNGLMSVKFCIVGMK